MITQKGKKSLRVMGYVNPVFVLVLAVTMTLHFSLNRKPINGLMQIDDRFSPNGVCIRKSNTDAGSVGE